MRSKWVFAVLVAAGFLPVAQADTPNPADIRISCVCVGKTFTDSSCTYVQLEETGINIRTGETIWTRTPAAWGNCNTRSQDDFRTCETNLHNEPLCRVN